MSIKVTRAETELEYQRAKWNLQDILEFYTYEMVQPQLISDGYGGMKVQQTSFAKDYRNAIRRIDTLRNLVRQNKTKKK